MILYLTNIITSTLGWSIKTISHMALEELLVQIIDGSLKVNSKMDRDMDIFERLIHNQVYLKQKNNFKMEFRLMSKNEII